MLCYIDTKKAYGGWSNIRQNRAVSVSQPPLSRAAHRASGSEYRQIRRGEELHFQKRSRACLKNAFRQMCVTVCGRFVPNEGRIAPADRNIVKSVEDPGKATCNTRCRIREELEWSVRPDGPWIGNGSGYVVDCLRSAFMIMGAADSYAARQYKAQQTWLHRFPCVIRH